MRNPNGFGGISYMGKNRRNPYRVRITTGWEYNEETGKAKQIYSTLGYFPTRKAAMIALAEYNKDPYDLDAEKVTFAEAYNSWAARELEAKSYSRRQQIKAAYIKCEPIYDLKMKDIKKKHLQDLMDEHSHLSAVAQTHIKSVFKIVFNYCMENDIVARDYSAFVKINAPDDAAEGIHSPFTTEEIALLWQSLNKSVVLSPGRFDETIFFPADTILMLIYTGMRPSELLNMRCENVFLKERYMIGGSKTAAGKKRVIPLHEDIVPLIEHRLENGGEYLIQYKIGKPAKLNAYHKYIFTPFMKELQMDHLPHDGRHTFATFAERCEINKLAVKMIMGHKSKDITENVYTHKERQELIDAVNKIVFYEK